MPILLPVTDNCPTWISGRERMLEEIISLSNLNKDIAIPICNFHFLILNGRSKLQYHNSRVVKAAYL